MKVLRILLLEDSLLDTELIQENLTDGGINCELVRVETRNDFIKALQLDSFDLILSDYSLPSFDGISALEIARPICPEVPFIFVSATLGEELAIETLKSGATDYVLKQRLARLAPVVHRALRETKERLERKRAQAERLHAQQALQRSEARFRQVFESKMIGMGFWDGNGNITELNDAFLELVGYSRSDFLTGRLCLQDITPPEYLARDERMCQESLDIGLCAPYEKEYICKNGSRIPVLIGSACFTESSDGGVFFALNLSERKQLENQLRQQAEELAQANRIKDEFLAVLSHELRSPLNPILGWAKLLRTRKVSAETTARAIETIERNAQVQTQLIEDLLDVSRIMQGKITLNVCPVNLASTVEAAMETVRLAAEAKSIQIHCLIDATVGLVSGDPNRLQQVIWNLLSNAVKFTPSGGCVSVLLECHDGQAQIQVSDTGKGISTDFLPYVFDYFRQADPSTTRKYGGLGLGLAIVRNLVELHGGTICADSAGEGEGATFTVKLPLMPISRKANFSDHIRVQVENEFPGEKFPALNGLQVLVVDDEADSREFLTVVLESCGAEVIPAASVLEAMKALDKFKPDVLVSDIAMPEEDGYTLIRKVRARSPEQGGRIPAAALTAYARAEDRTNALSAGFQIHLPKPVEPSEIAIVVASLARQIAKV